MARRLPPLDLDDLPPRMNALTGFILDRAIHVQRRLGPGLLERVYEAALAHVLAQAGHAVERQVVMPVTFEGVRLEEGYRIDLLVDGTVVVELKVAEALLPVHASQALSYVKLSDKPVGLLLNFGEVPLGVRRFVNSHVSEADGAA